MEEKNITKDGSDGGKTFWSLQNIEVRRNVKKFLFNFTESIHCVINIRHLQPWHWIYWIYSCLPATLSEHDVDGGDNLGKTAPAFDRVLFGWTPPLLSTETIANPIKQSKTLIAMTSISWEIDYFICIFKKTSIVEWAWNCDWAMWAFLRSYIKFSLLKSLLIVSSTFNYSNEIALMLLPPEIADESDHKKVKCFNYRKHRHAKKQSEDPTDIGQKSNHPVARCPFSSDKLIGSKTERA